MPHQVILVQPLHDDDDGSVDPVVQPRVQRRIVELGDAAAFGRREHRVEAIDRIVDHDEVGTAPQNRTADRTGKARTALAGLDLVLAVGLDGEPGEQGTIPSARHHAAEVCSMLQRQLIGIADRHDPLARIMAHHPGGIADRDADRFGRARRHIDDQPLALAPPDPHQLPGNRIDMPVRQIGCAGIERHEAARDEARQILTQDDVEQIGVSHRNLPQHDARVRSSARESQLPGRG